MEGQVYLSDAEKALGSAGADGSKFRNNALLTQDSKLTGVMSLMAVSTVH